MIILKILFALFKKSFIRIMKKDSFHDFHNRNVWDNESKIYFEKIKKGEQVFNLDYLPNGAIVIIDNNKSNFSPEFQESGVHIITTNYWRCLMDMTGGDGYTLPNCDARRWFKYRLLPDGTELIIEMKDGIQKLKIKSIPK